MVTITNSNGLFLIDGESVTHLHTSDGEKNLDLLESYLDEWDLNVTTDRDAVRMARDLLYDDARAGYRSNRTEWADWRHAAARLLNDVIGDEWSEVGGFHESEYDISDGEVDTN